MIDPALTWTTGNIAEAILTDELGEIASRRAQFVEPQLRRPPQSWGGPAQTISVHDLPFGGDASSLTGVAAIPGEVTGRARVVHDPPTTELDEGDILVCKATYPSLGALFMVAGAVVTDHGGLLSHGLIVARELGVPACAVPRSEAGESETAN